MLSHLKLMIVDYPIFIRIEKIECLLELLLLLFGKFPPLLTSFSQFSISHFKLTWTFLFNMANEYNVIMYRI